MERSSEIPYGARKILSSALIDLGTLASRSISRLARVELSYPCLARSWEEFGGSATRMPVHVLLSAATDHFHAFARLLRHEEPYAPSLAALLRAFGEVMGRAWWLLDAASPQKFAHRVAAMELSERVEAGGRQIGSWSADGTMQVLDDPIGDAQRHLERVRVPGGKERVPDFTRLFESVCDAAGVAAGRELYGDLSAASHGSSLAVSSLSHIGPRDERGWATVSLGLSLQTTERYLDVLVRVTELVVRSLAGAYSARDEVERLDQCIARVDQTCTVVLVAVERGTPVDASTK